MPTQIRNDEIRTVTTLFVQDPPPPTVRVAHPDDSSKVMIVNKSDYSAEKFGPTLDEKPSKKAATADGEVVPEKTPKSKKKE